MEGSNALPSMISLAKYKDKVIDPKLITPPTSLQSGIPSESLLFNYVVKQTRNAKTIVSSSIKPHVIESLVPKPTVVYTSAAGATSTTADGKAKEEKEEKEFKLERQPSRMNTGETTGPKWFDMPAPVITPEVERDLKALELRKYTDPKRFYKKDDYTGDKRPKFFHIGTIIKGNMDSQNQNLLKRERHAVSLNCFDLFKNTK